MLTYIELWKLSCGRGRNGEYLRKMAQLLKELCPQGSDISCTPVGIYNGLCSWKELPGDTGRRATLSSLMDVDEPLKQAFQDLKGL